MMVDCKHSSYNDSVDHSSMWIWLIRSPIFQRNRDFLFVIGQKIGESNFKFI